MTSNHLPRAAFLEDRAEAGGGSTRSLRICFVADPRSVHTRRWIRFFSQRRHHVALASPSIPPAELQLDAFYQLTDQSGLPGTRVLRNAWEVRDAAVDFRADVVHAHFINESGWLGALSGFRPFVLSAWGSDIYLAPKVSWLARVLNPWAVRRADLVTADSLDQVVKLRAWGATHAELVGWGVDLEAFEGGAGVTWRERNNVPQERVVILGPRQWIPNSNIPNIIGAFAILRRGGSNALLVLKESAEACNATRRAIEARVKEFALEDQVLVVGTISDDELAGLYEAADVTVSVCSSDGTPMSVLEAMAARSAVVAGDLPSLREWIHNDVNGLLVSATDGIGLSRCLARLASDRLLRERLGKAARLVVEERANRRTELLRMESLYLALVDKAASAKGRER